MGWGGGTLLVMRLGIIAALLRSDPKTYGQEFSIILLVLKCCAKVSDSVRAICFGNVSMIRVAIANTSQI